MLTYHFDKKSSIPMYEYLYECIKKDIIHKKLEAHEKLPSKRVFAKHLQVSLITIENAYNQLLIEGYIYSIEKKGYFISEIEYPEISQKETPILDSKTVKEYLIDLRTNSVSPSDFPFSVWSKITRQVLTSQDPSLLTRAPHNGCEVLRKAIAEHLHAFSGMSISQEQIVIGAGTEYLYNLVIQLLGRNQIYALENPGHKSIAKVYEFNDVKHTYITLDDCGLDVHKLKESYAKIVHISPAHHYPTGITMPIQRRLELLKWAKDNDGYIIEDDYDSEFRLRGNPIPSLLNIDQNERVLYMNTFSKTLAPSFRMSYMVLPLHLVKVYQELFGSFACSVSSFEQIILAHFIQEGYFEKHINRMRNSYKMIRNELLDALFTSPLSSHITIMEENAGLHFLLKYQNQIKDEQMIQRAQNIGLNITTLSSFYHESFSSQTLVINYSGLKKEQVHQAVQLLTKLILP